MDKKSKLSVDPKEEKSYRISDIVQGIFFTVIGVYLLVTLGGTFYRLARYGNPNPGDFNTRGMIVCRHKVDINDTDDKFWGMVVECGQYKAGKEILLRFPKSSRLLNDILENKLEFIEFTSHRFKKTSTIFSEYETYKYLGSVEDPIPEESEGDYNTLMEDAQSNLKEIGFETE